MAANIAAKIAAILKDVLRSVISHNICTILETS